MPRRRISRRLRGGTQPSTPSDGSMRLPSSSVALATSAGDLDTAEGTVSVTNAGPGALGTVSVGTIAYVSGTGWLEPLAVTQRAGAGALITVRANIAGLAAGSYQATFPVSATSSTNGPLTVTVNLTVAASPAVITTDSDTVTFTATSGATVTTPANVKVAVSNTGQTAFAGLSVSDNANWLTTSYSTGELTITPAGANLAALATGRHTATVTLTDANASADAVIDVELDVVAAPKAVIALSSSSVSSFSLTAGGSASTPTDATITISNTGASGSSLAGPSASSNATWLNAAVTGAGPTYTLTLTPTGAPLAALAAGTYTGVVTVSDANANATALVTVTINVAPAAGSQLLAIDTTLLDRGYTVGGSTPVQRSAGVRNASGGTLAGPTVSSVTYAGGGSGWATFTMSGNTCTVAFVAAALPQVAGTYSASVTISDASCSNTVPLRMELSVNGAVSPPILVVSPSALARTVTAGQAAAPLSFQVTNGGGGSLGTVTAATVAAQPSWISSIAIASNTCTVTLNTAALTAGSYAATVRVSATGASNSPVDVPLALTVSAVVVSTWNQRIAAGPRTAQLPAGWTWNGTKGYPEGSIFNTLSGFRGADNLAMPSFSGTEYFVTSASDWTTVRAALAAGTIVDGDIVTFTAGLALTDVNIPVRGGHTPGTNGFVWFRTSAHASLPAYSYANGPASFDAAHCVSRTRDLAYLAQFKTNTLNSSALNFSSGAGGYWFTGFDLYVNNASNTYTLFSIRPKSGTANASHTTTAQCPHTLVFDRCTASTSTGRWFLTVENEGRYVSFRHCDLGFAYAPNTVEPKGILSFNTDGYHEYLGNTFSGWGISVLYGGTVPSISQVIPANVIGMWNRIQHPLATVQQILLSSADGDECKNALEHKTGDRAFWGFNDIRNLGWRADQRYALLVKATDQNSSGNYQAKSTNICYWGNFIHGGKGFFGVNDIYAGVPTDPATGLPLPGYTPGGAALGCERLEARFNLHYYETSLARASDGVANTNTKQFAASILGSQGDGIPDLDVSDNTWSGRQAMWNLDQAPFGAGWRRLRLDNNVHWNGPQYGPVFSSNGDDSAAMNRAFGAGNWSMKRCFVLPANAAWDSTLLQSPWECGYLLSGGASANFANPTGYNLSLVGTSPAKGRHSDGDNTDPGYDRAYLAAMIPDGGF